MNKSYKAFFLFLIIFLSYLNFNYIFDTFYRYTFSEISITITLIRAIPLLILLLSYFFMLHYFEKLSIKPLFFTLSIFSLIAVQIYKFLYYYLLIDELNTNFIIIMYLLFIIFLILSLFKNFENKSSIIIFLFFILPASFCIQLLLILITSTQQLDASYTNPNRYEFVKYHYLNDMEFSSLPDELPDDATNIVFRYDSSMGTKTIHLEYNSATIDNEDQYIKYYISSPKQNK